MAKLHEIIKKYAVKNRLKYGKAYQKAVLGKVLAHKPELKKRIRGVRRDVKRVVEEVNELDKEELKKWKESEEKEKVERGYKVELPEEPEGKVRTRLAPNPNGAATLGSARGIVINHYLAKKYDGEFILRFDDTDPKNKRPMPEAYDWYLEDCEFLKAKPDEVYYASERVDKYYDYAEKLIEKGKAYICFCRKNKFKRLKDAKQPCPHRDISSKKNLERWKKMLKGGYTEGEAVLRIKTNIKHKDPALRDWVAFRILEREHPRVGGKYKVWPMLDFESAIEDKLLKITHVVRGKDLADSEKRQKFVYDYLGWEYPEVIHWGRVKIREFGKLSTSEIRKGIIRGSYKGWDDLKLPTIRAFRRRGISPDAIRKLILNLGINKTDISLSLNNLFAENRKMVDNEADRYFFVPEPVKVKVKGIKKKKLQKEIPLHPNFPNRGKRKFNFQPKKGKMVLYVSQEDTSELNPEDEIRLMHLFNITIEKTSPLVGKWLQKKDLHVDKFQWVPEENIPGEILMPDGKVEGLCEKNCQDLEEGEVVQLERFGFAKLEEKNEKLKFCFTHR